MKKIGDDVRVQDLFPSHKTPGSSGSREATVFGAPFALGMDREYAIVVNVGHVSSVGPREAVTAELLCGTTTYASPTAYTSVGGFTVCASGATQTQVNYARVNITGTATKVGTAFAGIAIDGTTFTFSATADSSVVVHTTDCSNAMAKLATCIKGRCTHLDATWYSAGVTTGPAYCEIYPRDGNRTFNITSTSIPVAASADGVGVLVSRSAMFEFKQEDIQQLSTVRYTHAAVRFNSTGTVCNFGGVLIAGGSRFKPNINISRGQLSTVSSAYTT